jgi:hypothetical protein
MSNISGMLRSVVRYKLTDVLDGLIASIVRAVRTSETSVNFYQATWRNIPEDSCLHTGRCENLKSHNDLFKNVNSCLKPQHGMTSFLTVTV